MKRIRLQNIKSGIIHGDYTEELREQLFGIAIVEV
jgi:hypothetical protein